MSVHPEVDLSKVTDAETGRLVKIELYEKAFLDKCFAELRPR